MKFCEKCGKELLDEAAICPGCGRTIGSADVSTAQPKHIFSWWNGLTKRKKRIICRVFIPVMSVALVLGMLAILILPHPNLKMKDFKDDGYIGALFHYGIPSRMEEDCWIYDDCIQFYGIPVFSFGYYPDEEKYVLFFKEEYSDDVYDEIRSHCDFEKNLLDIFHHFSYDSLKITCNAYDGSYVSINLTDL